MDRTRIDGAPEVLEAAVEDRGLGLGVHAEGVRDRSGGVGRLGVGGEGCAGAAVADVD